MKRFLGNVTFYAIFHSKPTGRNATVAFKYRAITANPCVDVSNLSCYETLRYPEEEISGLPGAVTGHDIFQLRLHFAVSHRKKSAGIRLIKRSATRTGAPEPDR